MKRVLAVLLSAVLSLSVAVVPGVQTLAFSSSRYSMENTSTTS